MQAQAPELLFSTVDLTGEVKEAPVRCISFNEDIEIEQSEDSRGNVGQEAGQFVHGGFQLRNPDGEHIPMNYLIRFIPAWHP